MENLRIQGGQMHITQENDAVYQILEGHVLVYLFPYKNEKAGRRQFLVEMTKGEQIVGFASNSDLFGTWRLGLVALDTAVLQLCTDNTKEKIEEIKETFASRMGLRLFDMADYEEQLIEK